MRHVIVDGVRLAYEVEGEGEPVVLIHAGLVADFFAPLMGRPELAGYQLIRYHRAGYADTRPAAEEVDIGRHANHCRNLLRHLGVDRAHLVGHSSSAAIALQLSLDEPAAVASLALLEIALLAVPSAPPVGEAIAQYRTGDRRAATDTFLRAVCGPDYRGVLDHAIPGAFDQAVADADTFFEQELPALRGWSFGSTEGARIIQPTLVVLGARSSEVNITFAQRNDLLLTWLPNAEPFLLADATHLLQAENPGGMARGLADFIVRNPIW